MIPATSQLSLLSSTTAINVWLGSNGVSERLRSFSGLCCCFGLRIEGLHRPGCYRRRWSHRSVNNLPIDADFIAARPIASQDSEGARHHDPADIARTS